MSIKKKTTPIKLEPVILIWGVEQCRSYKVISAATAGGKYMEVNFVNGLYEEVKGYIYFDDGDDVDPAPAGRTLITVVDFLVADTETELAAKIKAALELSVSADYMAIEIDDLDSENILIENKIPKSVSAETAGDSGFTYALLNAGVGGNLGKTAQGGITMNLETSTFELKSDQTAEVLLGEINQGNLVSLETNLIELTEERFQAIIGSVVGENIDLGNGKTYVGIGTSRLYQELSSLGGRMILHPQRIADLADRTEDWSFHITAPLPSSINFSGTEQQGMDIAFKPYVDESKPAAASVGGFGDWLELINL